MATTQSASQKAAQKRLTKAEFKLYTQSSSDLKSIPRERIRKARARTVELVKRHRKNARAKMDDKVASREVNFRLRSMEKVLERFDRILKKQRLEKRKAKAARGKKSLTEQPKMHLKRADEPRESFLRRTKQKMYNKRTVQADSHFENAPQMVGKRVAGYSSARSRKGQVARDRRNAIEE
ncbi:hypothetical protein DOM22_17015 [Bdellovibrio sp. ZAP7]|uniref:hypothetical protein n=1 Tax=Bdellovibrio sp. ZAP7 TaxID=2231053 RepID=UPI001157EE8B|nr:hypothetical protein [Bdellovibrio sp. ZAP7]QDK46734.1 hypothetical protein DOM22_17015 [Bdellovibrio sp. ZAP7]